MIEVQKTFQAQGNTLSLEQIEWQAVDRTAHYQAGQTTDQASSSASRQGTVVNTSLTGRPGSELTRADFVVRPDDRGQRFYGFGGAFTEASAWLYSQLPGDKRQEFIQAYFSMEKSAAGGRGGCGYTLGRVHMNSCDFSLGNYSCTPLPNDHDLSSFSIERDRQWVIPMIRDALAVQPELEIMVSPWSPPWWMKDNQQMNYGGSLKREYYPLWAQHFVRFIQAYAEHGITVHYASVQNEPEAKQIWDSCLYTAEQETEFIRDHLGPALQGAGLDQVKILAWDHNRDRLHERCQVTLGDSNAARYIWGIGYHWYSGLDSELLAPIRERYPDKPLFLTESTIEGGAKPGQWDRGEIYARHILRDLHHGCSGWIDWNLLLDRRGGPNHVGNFCDAPVLTEPDKGILEFQTSFTYMGHLSRNIRPGAVKMGVEEHNSLGLYAVAFENPGGNYGMVVVNPTEHSRELRVYPDEAGTKFCTQLIPAHGVISLSWNPRG